MAYPLCAGCCYIQSFVVHNYLQRTGASETNFMAWRRKMGPYDSATKMLPRLPIRMLTKLPIEQLRFQCAQAISCVRCCGLLSSSYDFSSLQSAMLPRLSIQQSQFQCAQVIAYERRCGLLSSSYDFSSLQIAYCRDCLSSSYVSMRTSHILCALLRPLEQQL